MFTPITASLNPSASRTARQLFYWISTLAVTLIAALTLLEAFGVYVFPHRSWSEGINPKVIQTRGGATYYRYIEVKPSDLQRQLPAGVRATFVGVLIEVPVMLSVCSFCNRTRHWFPQTEAADTV